MRIKENVDLKVLEQYGWELDNLDCFTTCKECKINHCIPKEEQYYFKDISDILQYTILKVNNNDRKIKANFDEGSAIFNNDKNYKYVIEACKDLIEAGLIDKL